jgi:hypothetical protein
MPKLLLTGQPGSYTLSLYDDSGDDRSASLDAICRLRDAEAEVLHASGLLPHADGLAVAATATPPATLMTLVQDEEGYWDIVIGLPHAPDLGRPPQLVAFPDWHEWMNWGGCPRQAPLSSQERSRVLSESRIGLRLAYRHQPTETPHDG